MALVEDPRSIYVPEVCQDITFFYDAFLSGKMSGLFTLKILYKQHGDADKVVFQYGYIFTSQRDTIWSIYGIVDTNIAMATAGFRTMLQWLLKNAQPFSAALILVNMSASSVNEYVLKPKSRSILGHYA